MYNKGENMTRPSIDEMLEITESRYTLVTAISKRARSIVRLEKKTDEEVADEMGRDKSNVEKPVIRAIKDIYKGKYEIVLND